MKMLFGVGQDSACVERKFINTIYMAKVHPMGYIPVKNKTSRKQHFGESLDYVQTIKMANGQIRSIKHYKSRLVG